MNRTMSEDDGVLMHVHTSSVRKGNVDDTNNNNNKRSDVSTEAGSVNEDLFFLLIMYFMKIILLYYNCFFNQIVWHGCNMVCVYEACVELWTKLGKEMRESENNENGKCA